MAEAEDVGTAPLERVQSGDVSRFNRGGKVPGLAAQIRALSQDGTVIARFVMSLVTGDEPAPPAVRLDAARWLAERAYGKTPDLVVTASATTEQARALMEAADGGIEALARSLAPPPASARTLDATPLATSDAEPPDVPSASE